MGYSPFYFIGQTLKNIWRNIGMSIASVLILIACLLVTGSFYAVDRNITYNLDGLGGLNKILVYINEACPDDQIRRIKAQAENCAGAKSVQLITKEEALADEKAKLGEEYAGVFDWLGEGENPYRASLEVEYSADADVKKLESDLQAIEGVDTLVSRSDLAEKVASVKSIISRVFWGMMLLLFVVSVFVIITSVRLALSARRKEIVIMRYVGATGLFIMIPFLLEGLLLGLLAALLAFGVQNVVYTLLQNGMAKNFFGLITLVPASSMSTVLLIGFLIIGTATGLLGSIISLARYLNK